jgi:competence protein CoiA
MIFAINEEKGIRVDARTSIRGPDYTCPYCEEDVVIKKGIKKTHHFAHKKNTSCEWSGGESIEHLNAKIEIYDALREHSQVDICEMELYFKKAGVRPDIIFNSRYSNVPVVVEIQKSNIDIDIIKRRYARYKDLEVALIWLFLNPPEKDKRKRIKDWEKFIQSMSFGRVYYWVEGLNIQPCRLELATTHVPAREIWDSDVDEYITVGGYDKKLKSTVTPNYPDNVINLVEDFDPMSREDFKMDGEVKYPSAILYSDQRRYSRWW